MILCDQHERVIMMIKHQEVKKHQASSINQVITR